MSGGANGKCNRDVRSRWREDVQQPWGTETSLTLERRRIRSGFLKLYNHSALDFLHQRLQTLIQHALREDAVGPTWAHERGVRKTSTLTRSQVRKPTIVAVTVRTTLASFSRLLTSPLVTPPRAPFHWLIWIGRGFVSALPSALMYSRAALAHNGAVSRSSFSTTDCVGVTPPNPHPPFFPCISLNLQHLPVLAEIPRTQAEAPGKEINNHL